jgi:RNA polymerase sigma-70 factor (sigma-E family)
VGVGHGASLMRRSERERDRQVAALFDAHYRPLCRLAYVILGDAGMAEEVVMDALVKTFSGWRAIRDPARSDVYLKRIVVNLCRSRIRRKAVEARANTAAHARATRVAPGWDVDRHETQRTVLAAVRDLPERQRACVVLRYYEDLPESEIARVLDCSVGTVKSQLSKARARLGRSLDETLPGGER